LADKARAGARRGQEVGKHLFRPNLKIIFEKWIVFGDVAIFCALIATLSSSNAQTPADDVATQVRAQGYRCDQPVTAKRDARLSKPDSPVWILKCNNVTYRVRLDPDMAAHVKKIK
jgi:hypothetical protein